MKKRAPEGLAYFDPYEGTPVLAAYRQTLPDQRDTDLLLAWCSFCGKFHIHGGQGKTPLQHDTHRRPHCVLRDESPYARSGYFLREVGPFPKEWDSYL